MTDGDALLAAILAHPDEDTPRLAYADWLDENGGAQAHSAGRAGSTGAEWAADRAEFIRVQVEIARLEADGVRAWDRSLRDLRTTEKRLLTLHGAAWLAPLRQKGAILQHPDTFGQFRRGFVEVVWMPAAWAMGLGENLFSQAPVRELRLIESTPGGFRSVLAWPLLARLDGLDLSDRRLGDAAIDELTRSRHADGLRVLRMRGCGVTDVGAFALAHADRPLVELDVSNNPISREGVAALRRRFGDAVRATGP